MSKKKKIYFLVLYSLCGFLFMTKKVYAYVDPSVMTYAIQALAGIVIALGTFFGIYWRKVREYLIKTFHLDLGGEKERETDDFVYCDPKTGVERHIAVDDKRIASSTSEDEEDNNQAHSSILKDLSPALFLSVAFSFLLTIFAPLEIYMTNVNDMWFDTTILLPRILVAFILLLVLGLIVYIISYVLYKPFYKTMLIFGVIMLICTYIQGNFMTSALPVIDGADINWNHYHRWMFYSVILLIITTVIIVLVIRVLGQSNIYIVTKGVSVLVSLVLVVTLTVISVSSGALRPKTYYTITTKNEFEMSAGQNFVIFVPDCVDASYFTEVLENNNSYKEVFKDFTYYNNTTSAYPYTSASIPYILGGEFINNDERLCDYNKRLIDNSAFLHELENKGYSLGLYEPDIDLSLINSSRIENYSNSSPAVKNNKTFIKNILKFVWFKYAPYYLKPLVNINIDMFSDLQDIVTRDGEKVHQFYNPQYFEQLNEGMVTLKDQKAFKFIHFEGAHAPYRYDKNVNIIARSEGSYQKNIECSITITKTYLDKLKDADVYDNSVIIIMADHGYNTARNEEIDKPETIGRQNPILLIKGINERHNSMQVSSVPVAHADLQEAYIKLLDGAASDNLFDFEEDEKRDRLYYLYNLYTSDYFSVQIIHGDATDLSQIEDTGIKVKRNKK